MQCGCVSLFKHMHPCLSDYNHQPMKVLLPWPCGRPMAKQGEGRGRHLGQRGLQEMPLFCNLVSHSPRICSNRARAFVLCVPQPHLLLRQGWGSLLTSGKYPHPSLCDVNLLHLPQKLLPQDPHLVYRPPKVACHPLPNLLLDSQYTANSERLLLLSCLQHSHTKGGGGQSQASPARHPGNPGGGGGG